MKSRIPFLSLSVRCNNFPWGCKHIFPLLKNITILIETNLCGTFRFALCTWNCGCCLLSFSVKYFFKLSCCFKKTNKQLPQRETYLWEKTLFQQIFFPKDTNFVREKKKSEFLLCGQFLLICQKGRKFYCQQIEKLFRSYCASKSMVLTTCSVIHNPRCAS